MVWTWQKQKIKKRWQEYPEELYKKDLQDPDNHDGIITHLEPDILEWEAKWALGNITMNKASGGDGIPVELFQILKDDAVKGWTLYASKFGKLSSSHRTGKGQFSFQSPKKRQCQRMFKLQHNHTYPMLTKRCSKFSKLSSNTMWTENFQMFKLDLEKAKEPEIKLPASVGS